MSTVRKPSTMTGSWRSRDGEITRGIRIGAGATTVFVSFDDAVQLATEIADIWQNNERNNR